MAIFAVARRISTDERGARYGVHRDDAPEPSWIVVVPADPDAGVSFEGETTQKGYPIILGIRARERFLSSGEWPRAVGFNA